MVLTTLEMSTSEGRLRLSDLKIKRDNGLDMCRGGVVDMYWTKDTEDGAAGQEEKEEGGCSEGRTRRGFV